MRPLGLIPKDRERKLRHIQTNQRRRVEGERRERNKKERQTACLLNASRLLGTTRAGRTTTVLLTLLDLTEKADKKSSRPSLSRTSRYAEERAKAKQSQQRTGLSDDRGNPKEVRSFVDLSTLSSTKTKIYTNELCLQSFRTPVRRLALLLDPSKNKKGGERERESSLKFVVEENEGQGVATGLSTTRKGGHAEFNEPNYSPQGCEFAFNKHNFNSRGGQTNA